MATEARTTLLLSLHVALWPVLWRGLASTKRTIVALVLLLLVLRARGHVTIGSLEARRHASGKALVHRERQGAARHTHGRVPTHKRLQKQDDENCQITCVVCTPYDFSNKVCYKIFKRPLRRRRHTCMWGGKANMGGMPPGPWGGYP